MNYLYQFLNWIMDGCYNLCNNYGLAIILFTLCSKIILLPVSVWTHFNSINMIKMQPDINFLKVKYYGQNDIIAEEQAKLNKKYKYSPLASTIPLIVQLVLLMGVIEVIKAGIANPEIDMMFGPIHFGEIPSEVGVSLLWVPVIAGLSSWILSVTQNASNVLQAEQSKANKYGMMIFSIGLSVYLGWFVSVGTVFYWVCSNLMAVAQMYILNWLIKPSKYVDYERLEESRKALATIQNVGKKKEGFFSENKKRERADYKRFFSVVNKHLVFYSESNGFYKYFKGFIEYILEHTNITIHYITSDPNDAIFQMEKENPQIRGYYIGENKLITLMMKLDTDVMVMTMPDLENYHIKRSYLRKDIEYVFVQHGMGSNNLTFRKGSTAYFDTVFCAGIHQKEEEEQMELVYGFPKKKLLEIGYPLIDDMRAKYASTDKTANKRKKILIAPSWQEDNIIDSCLEELLEALKGNDYEIIVRPHPQEVRLKKDYMNALKQKYEADGIEIQTDFNSNNPVMQADVLITDWSDISWEYAFTTYRPVVFIDTSMKIMNPEYQKIDIVPLNILLRDKVGKNLKVEELNKLNDTVQELLTNADAYHEQIKSLANQFLYNLDNSAEVGGRYIVNAIKDKVSKKSK